jgi:tetratricopeptide (TPR) repeat protein/tRNA A-37 threonylcarbamoyl transferase component Bud32
MTDEQRELIDRLFADAATLPREQRADFLTANCPDPGMRSELDSLLACATETPTVRVKEAIAEAAAAVADAVLIGERVGPYRIRERIGEGGMGSVYQAQRADQQFQQTVAIKMLRFAQSDQVLVERFRRERQILAGLEHPHIARLLNGGNWIPPGSAQRQPYIVMEYVEGLPLTVYCTRKNLSIRERVQLFRQVCEAVSYAHQQLVVHRDLKPANILVTPGGRPKLLDFGIARLLDTETDTGATATATLWRAMTPDYASPEQVRGEPVSTSSDVYSLGAVLYELLTDRRAHHFPDYDPLNIAKEICERQIEPPSTVGCRELRGDLDVIVLKAMQIEPVRRYSSVEQFSQDLQRYLDGLPILARPDTVFYRAGKFTRRHRAGLAAAVAVLVALLGAVVVSTREARRADAEAATANAVNNFLQNDLLAQASATAQASPGAKPDPDLKVRTVLDRAAARIQGKFTGQPLVEASIRTTLGTAYEDLGLFGQARQQMERALQLQRSAAGENAPSTLKSMASLADIHVDESHFELAEAILTKVLAIERRLLGEEHIDTLNTAHSLATVYCNQGKYSQAETLYVRLLEIQRRVPGEDHPDTLALMNDFGVLYISEGKYAQAEQIIGDAVRRARRVHGEEHPGTLVGLRNLASTYWIDGRFAEADAAYSAVLQIELRILGERHPDTLETTAKMAVNYLNWGKFSEAERLLVKVAELRRQVVGEDHWDTLNALNYLGTVYGQQGKHAQAAALFRKVLDGYRRTTGEQDWATLNAAGNLAAAYGHLGQYAKAEAMLTHNVESLRSVLGDSNRVTLMSVSALGKVYVLERKYDLAEPLFATVVAESRRQWGETNCKTVEALLDLSSIWLQQQRYAELEAQLRGPLQAYKEKGFDLWTRYRVESILGASLATQKRYQEAEQLLLSGYEGMIQRRSTIPAYYQSALKDAADWMLQLYQDWGKPDQAAAWRGKAASRPLKQLSSSTE